MFELRPYRRNSINVWNPFSEMEEMEKRLFNNNFFSNADLAEFKTDITDEGNHYLLKADLPGFKKEDIHLNLDGDTLTIQAERHSEHEDTNKKKTSTSAVSAPTVPTAVALMFPASGLTRFPPATKAAFWS